MPGASAPWPSVTTVIPAFNAEAFLGEAIESVFSQDYPDVEVIVVDDGSTDGTAELAECFSGVRLIGQRNQGPAAARNAAIAAARGELIALLDADDLMAPGRLRTQAGYLMSHPEAAGVIGLQENVFVGGVDPPQWIARHEARPEEDPNGNSLPINGDHAAPSLVARRRVYDTVGGYDPSYLYAEDVDWFLRVLETGMTIGTIDEVVLIRRFHGSNMTYDQGAMRQGVFRAFKGRIDRNRRRGSAPRPE